MTSSLTRERQTTANFKTLKLQGSCHPTPQSLSFPPAVSIAAHAPASSKANAPDAPKTKKRHGAQSGNAAVNTATQAAPTVRLCLSMNVKNSTTSWQSYSASSSDRTEKDASLASKKRDTSNLCKKCTKTDVATALKRHRKSHNARAQDSTALSIPSRICHSVTVTGNSRVSNGAFFSHNRL